MKVKQNQLITALTNITHETLKEVLNSEIKTLYSIPVQKISPLWEKRKGRKDFLRVGELHGLPWTSEVWGDEKEFWCVNFSYVKLTTILNSLKVQN